MTTTIANLALDGITEGIEARGLIAAVDRNSNGFDGSSYGTIVVYTPDLDPVLSIGFSLAGTSADFGRNGKPFAPGVNRVDRAVVRDGKALREAIRDVLAWVDTARKERAEAAAPDPVAILRGSRWRLTEDIGSSGTPTSRADGVKIPKGTLVEVIDPSHPHLDWFKVLVRLPDGTTRALGAGLPNFAEPVHRDVQFALLVDVHVAADRDEVVGITWDFGQSCTGEFDPVAVEHVEGTPAAEFACGWLDARRGTLRAALTPTTVPDPQEVTTP